MLLNKIKSIAVIGSGLMGSGIAQVSAAANHQVFLIDQNEEILSKAMKGIESNLSRIAKKKFEDDKTKQQDFITNSLELIKPSSHTEQAISNVDLVIEAIVENLAVKQKLLDLVEGATKTDTIIATNTSSLKLSDISAKMRRKDNFGGLHFFNPVPIMKLLEIVRTDFTSDNTFNSLMNYGESIGKVTVSCKDTPGFIVNRLLVPYLIEAVRLYERGEASIEDIDKAMKLGAGYPMGPFQLLDYVGLDTTKFIIDGWNSKYPDEPLFKPSAKINELVSMNKLGMKTGEGFYPYTAKM